MIIYWITVYMISNKYTKHENYNNSFTSKVSSLHVNNRSCYESSSQCLSDANWREHDSELLYVVVLSIGDGSNSVAVSVNH